MTASKSFYLFASQVDLLELLRSIEIGLPLQYVSFGLLTSPNLMTYRSVLEIERFGITDLGTQLPVYLVTRADLEITARPVPQRAGGTRYSITQEENPGSLAFTVGGDYKDEAVLMSSIGTVHHDEDSKKLSKVFGKEIRTRFQRAKVGSYWIGPEAAKKARRANVRLTSDIAAPRATDLRIENCRPWDV